MPITGDAVIRSLAPVLLEGAPEGVAWSDAHTHMGANDPDGVTGTAQEILDGLEAAGHARALIFAMHEPAGYPAANDAVLAACAASGGRLSALARVDPKAPGALEEVRRCLDAGAVGVKLHPRSDAFGLPHPVVSEIVALAGAERRPVLFHAGRGIPELGRAAVELAADHPEARIILAHAGISDLGAIAGPAAELPNLLFDTAWWQAGDMLDLVTSIAPGQILYASDMPYGHGLLHGFLFRRVTAAAGWSPEQVATAAGAQLERILAREELTDAGPAVGAGALGPRVPRLERVVGHTDAAIQMAFSGGDPTEPLALARSGCAHVLGDPVAGLLLATDRLLALASEHRAAAGGEPRAIVPAAIVAHWVAATPTAGIPSVP